MTPTASRAPSVRRARSYAKPKQVIGWEGSKDAQQLKTLLQALLSQLSIHKCNYMP